MSVNVSLPMFILMLFLDIAGVLALVAMGFVFAAFISQTLQTGKEKRLENKKMFQSVEHFLEQARR